MDDSALWAVALGIGALGFLFLTIAGAVAMVLETRKRRARGVTSAEKSPSRAEDKAPDSKSRPHAGGKASRRESQLRTDLPRAKRTSAGGFWAWVKAWVFAVVHAGTVSLVLGGITLFEDLAKASDEIQRTGTVSFPKQLLPGRLSEHGPQERLSRPSGGLLSDGHGRGDDQQREAHEDDAEAGDLDQPNGTSPDAAGWEVVDLVNEAGAERDV